MKVNILKSIAHFFIIAIGTILFLKFGQEIIVQFILAYLLWFATIQIKKSAQKFKFFNYIPKILQTTVILLIILAVVSFIVRVLIVNITSLTESFPAYELNIVTLNENIKNIFHIDLTSKIITALDKFNVGDILSHTVESLSNIFASSMMVFIYLLFIFLETESFSLKMKTLFSTVEAQKKFFNVLRKIELSLSSYFRVKTLTSLLTAILSFIALYFVGVDSAILWAFLIFLLNYIPTVGSLIATFFPAIFSLLQFGTFAPFFIILFVVGAIQIVVGNFIEPRLMGKSLNISPLVTILTLTLWGQLWGVTGMLLSVPITVTFIIILSQFKSTEKIAILLSEKGEISSE